MLQVRAGDNFVYCLLCYRYFDVAEFAAIDWYRLLMKDVEALCDQQVL